MICTEQLAHNDWLIQSNQFHERIIFKSSGIPNSHLIGISISRVLQIEIGLESFKNEKNITKTYE